MELFGLILLSFACVTIVLSIFWTIRSRQIRKKHLEAQRPYAFLHTLNPNTCKGEVQFFYELPEQDQVKFCILDAEDHVQKVLFDATQEPGDHPLYFDTTELQNGSYLYQLTTSNQKVTKKFCIEN